MKYLPLLLLFSCNLISEGPPPEKVEVDVGKDFSFPDVATCKCDPLNMAESCESLGFGGGTLKCGEVCNFNTSDCSAALSCGDRKLDTNEQCEGLDLNGKTCQSMGFVSGELSCSDNCGFDTSMCSNCGNGVLEPGEMCDGESFGFQTCANQSPGGVGYGALGCSANCEILETNCYTIEKTSAGERHSCAITSDTKIVCWGANEVEQSSPPPGQGFTDIASGASANCAIDQAHFLSCWGDTRYDLINVPANVISQKISQVRLSWNHACAITMDGELLCWGDNSFGQSDLPSGIYLEVAVGSGFTCAINDKNETICQGTTHTNVIPTDVHTGIGAKLHHSCALKGDEISCWGSNGVGQLDSPAGSFSLIAVGGRHSCGFSSGQIVCWGQSENDKLESPVGVFKSISAGYHHTCAVTEAGEVNCWGDNASGQLDLE